MAFTCLRIKDKNEPEIEVDIRAFLDNSPETPGVQGRFSATGQLLFFAASLRDNDSNKMLVGYQPGGVYGEFLLNIEGNSRGRPYLRSFILK